MTDINNTATVPNSVTPAPTKPPTLPVLLTEHIEIDKRMASMERIQVYFLVLFVVFLLIQVAGLVGMAFLIGHVR